MDDGREDEGVKISAPRTITHSASRPVETTSASGIKPKLPVAENRKAPPQIKFGPPKGAKKPNGASSDPVGGPATQRAASVEMVSGAAPAASSAATFNSNGNRSRGPSPPISRSPTPAPQVEPRTSSTSFPNAASTIDQPAAPSRAVSITMRSASARPATPPPHADKSQRSISVQPAPPNWEGCAFTTAAPGALPIEREVMPALRTSMLPGATPPPPSSVLPIAAAIPTSPSASSQPGSSTAEATISTAVGVGSPLELGMDVDGANTVASSLQSLLETVPETSAMDNVIPQQPPSPVRRAAHPPPPGSIVVPTDEDISNIQTEKKARKRKGVSLASSHKKQMKTSGKASHTASSNTADAASTSASNGRPLWINNAVSILQTTKLGPEWDLLLSNWLKFEERTQFQEGGLRLGAKRRPLLVANWIQYARNPTFHAEIKNVAAFAADFSAWWQGLQPGWRRANSDDQTPRQAEEWDSIRRPGLNGLLSVVAALFFWGSAVQSTAARSVWLEAAKDVSFVLEQLL